MKLNWTKAKTKLCGGASHGTALKKRGANSAHTRLAGEVADAIDGVLIAGIEDPNGNTYIVLADAKDLPENVGERVDEAEMKRLHAARIVTLGPEATELTDVDTAGEAFDSLMAAQKVTVARGWVQKGEEAHAALVAACAYHDARAVVKFFPAIKGPLDMIPLMSGRGLDALKPELAGQLAAMALVSFRLERAAELLKVKGSSIYAEGLDTMLREVASRP